jgi:hypothetical protein
VAVFLATYVAWLYRPLFSRAAILTDERLWPYQRARSYLLEFAAGHLPAVLPDAVRGGGYAFPFFYPPLGQYAAASLFTLTGSAIVGVHLTFALGLWLSATAMLWTGLRLGWSLPAAALSAVFYVSFPYRWTLIFGRGALAESWTFIWYPLVLAGAWEVWRTGRIRWWFPLSVGALVLSHTVMAAYFLVLLAIVLTLCWRHRRPGAMLRIGLAMAAGIALAAWYLLPALTNLPKVRAGEPAIMWADVARVGSLGLGLLQVLGLTGLSSGYGANVGMVQLALPFLAIALRHLTNQRGPIPDLGVSTLLAWLVAVIFVSWPQPFLAVLPQKFAYVQFPWRLLGLAGFFTSVCLGVFVGAFGNGVSWLLALLICAGALLGKPPSTIRSAPAVTSSALGRLPVTLADSGYTVQAEYLPVEADPTTIAYEIGEGMIIRSGGVHAGSWDHEKKEAQILTSDAAEVVLPIVAYPFYRIDIDGMTAESHNTRGRLSINVPAGRHVVAVQRQWTWSTRIGFVVSLAALVATVALTQFSEGSETLNSRANG